MPRAPIKALPDAAELRELFAYDPNTGVLTWLKKMRRGLSEGSVAGTVGARGYLSVGIGRQYYFAHRLIWKIVTGSDPSAQVDHIDGDRLNNRWANLRPATNGQNLWNAKRRADNRSGVKGVSWDAQQKKWAANITINRKLRRLGRFSSVAEAAEVVNAERIRLHGEFARLA
jgi:hypothetical protein